MLDIISDRYKWVINRYHRSSVSRLEQDSWTWL